MCLQKPVTVKTLKPTHFYMVKLVSGYVQHEYEDKFKLKKIYCFIIHFLVFEILNHT